MRYIIIGGSSSIGFSLISFFKKKKIKFIGTYNSNKSPGLIKFNIIKDNLKNIIRDINRQDTIIIFSAIVSPLEVIKKKIKSNNINIIGTKRIINQAANIGCKIIFISSAEVFDGKRGNYKENSKTNPLTTYGKHKKKIENYLINKIKKNFSIVRLCWTISMSKFSKDAISLTYNTILKKNARMAYDNFFNITHANNVSEGIFKISKKNIKIIHLVSKQIISRYNLAKLIKRISKKGKKMKFEKIKFKEFVYLEPRARLNFLNTKFKNNYLNIKYVSLKKIVYDKIKILDKK
tara:strand:- start:551 stop:1426 length:876 start_codon:yes stop_codon:yes gene_type:complete